MTTQEPQDSRHHYQTHQQKEKVKLNRLDGSSYLSLHALKQTQSDAHHSFIIPADLMSSALIYLIKVDGSTEWSLVGHMTSATASHPYQHAHLQMEGVYETKH